MRLLATLVLSAVLGLILAGCRPPRRTAPPGGWYAPYKEPSCAPRGDDLPCVACAKASCCHEVNACQREAYPPDSSARAEAAAAGCWLRCRATQRDAECQSRCGAENDLYRAASVCLATHCPAVCPQGGFR